MSGYTKFKMYFETFGILVITILYLIRVVKRKPIITLKDVFGKKQERYQTRVNLVAKIILGLLIIVSNVEATVPRMLDLPYVIRHEYKTFEGYTTSRSMGKSDINGYERNFNIKNEDEEIHITTYTYRVEVGIYMKVNYLPHSKLATVIYRSDRPDE